LTVEYVVNETIQAMRKTILTTLTLFITLFSFGQDKRAEAILDQMSKKYQNIKTFNASFTYGADGRRATRGAITTSGTKFKLNMAGQEIMNNGKEIYTYMSDVNEVNVTSFDPSADNIFSPSNIYNIYKKGYKYVFKGESNVGSQVYETVELIPTKSNNNISKVQIKVNKRDKSIKSWKIWDDRGRATNFNITKFTPNVAAPASLFTFDTKKHPGVEVVDLR